MARRPVPDPSGPPGVEPRQQSTIEHLRSLATQTIPPLHPAGIPFVAVPAAVAVLTRRKRWISRPATIFAAASAAFFRNPSRVPPTESGVVVAAADGEVALVDEVVPLPELGLGDRPVPRVSTFLSVFDVHVQYAPISGAVETVTRTAGKFLSADLPAASTDNERTSMIIRTDDDVRIGVIQIAGLIARRIVCDAGPGDALTIGTTYGLIRFGSRVDIYLPAGSVPRVQVGQRTIGGETVIATLPQAPA
ncbi:phosphatidylserine decarboxylase [Gordonia effusa NBRC 100432]|uniref:Phosphatidylserine decarboxylase proenzyme n=1 Tax=Gordonia effusa NBRC 100432 TaxID=1077974 RepID=H0QXM8_9ACTN|nr:phosphatidylserine decarboxylase [Gordonia effusa]GAB17579.1 phosphatidylserine decarboxylase [Gordonia effusa NBRC 100432]